MSVMSRFVTMLCVLVVAGWDRPGAEAAQGPAPEPTPAPAASPAPARSPGPSPPPVTVATATPAPVEPLRLHMADGQLVSHAVLLHLTGDIPENATPRLQLIGGNALEPATPAGGVHWTPSFVATGQQWIEPAAPDGARPVATRTGTLLAFDLSSLTFNGKAMRRFRPAVTWTEGGVERRVVGPHDVNIGHMRNAGVWTSGIVGAVLLAIMALVAMRGSRLLALLMADDGHLSLAQAQIACWTVAVGAVVMVYGLIRLAIPEIPTSVLALMGASLVTGGLGFVGDQRQQQVALQKGIVPAPPAADWRLSDLLHVFAPGKEATPSLAKAQMLFWTVLLIVLFVSKSLLEGGIWNVPWPLVALLGFSQAGYLAPKVVPTP